MIGIRGLVTGGIVALSLAVSAQPAPRSVDGPPGMAAQPLGAALEPLQGVAPERAGPEPAAALCSIHYCLQQSTLNTAGLQATGVSYLFGASLGQEATTGCSSGNFSLLQSGFWGSFGSTLVPVVLMMRKYAGDPLLPQLDWSGNNPPYLLYRATNCALIYNAYYDSTILKSYIDETPSSEPLTCYNVMASPLGLREPASPELSGAVRLAGSPAGD